MVGKIEIIYSEDFIGFLDELTKTLYDLGYFGFVENAEFYVEKIYDFISANIDTPINKTTPDSHKKFGNYYLKYKANYQTTWYIFFDCRKNRYLINHILNNHTKDFSELL